MIRNIYKFHLPRG